MINLFNEAQRRSHALCLLADNVQLHEQLLHISLPDFQLLSAGRNELQPDSVVTFTCTHFHSVVTTLIQAWCLGS